MIKARYVGEMEELRGATALAQLVIQMDDSERFPLLSHGWRTLLDKDNWALEDPRLGRLKGKAAAALVVQETEGLDDRELEGEDSRGIYNG